MPVMRQVVLKSTGHRSGQSDTVGGTHHHCASSSPASAGRNPAGAQVTSPQRGHQAGDQTVPQGLHWRHGAQEKKSKLQPPGSWLRALESHRHIRHI